MDLTARLDAIEKGIAELNEWYVARFAELEAAEAAAAAEKAELEEWRQELARKHRAQKGETA